jgi:hypothetical protein
MWMFDADVFPNHGLDFEVGVELVFARGPGRTSLHSRICMSHHNADMRLEALAV